MRWEALFDDLEAQLAAAGAAELAADVSDRGRSELSRVRLHDRARVAIGADVAVAVEGAGTVTGRIVRAAPQWWLLATASGQVLLATGAIGWVTGLPATAGDPEQPAGATDRLGLGHVLRALARDRAAVAIVFRDGSTLTGTIDRVGADFADVAEHAPAEPRRSGSVRAGRTVAFAALALVRAS